MYSVFGFVAVLAVLLFAENVFARSGRVSQIPNGSTLGCSSCHVSAAGGGARTGFGNEINNNFLTASGRNGSVVWNATLANLDSDGDGFSNGTELGDPDGDGTPTAGAQVTNPGSATSFPQVVNNAPTFTAVTAQSAHEGDMVTFAVSASDQDNDAVTITASDLPSGATFESGTFTWIPGFDQSGMFTVNFSATDGKDPAALAVAVTVTDVPQAPVFTALDSQTGKEGEALTFNVTVSDVDGDDVTLTTRGLPDGASFDNGTLVWTPGFDQAGAHTLTFIASDGTLETTVEVQVSVENVVQPLAIASISPIRDLLIAGAGETVNLSVVASADDLIGVAYAWSINGVAQAETSSSLTVIVSAGDADDVISVSLSDASGTVAQSWTVSKTLKGDFNGNNEVDFPDFLAFVGAFGKSSSDVDFNIAMDLSGNGAIDFPDFLQFVRFFGLKQ